MSDTGESPRVSKSPPNYQPREPTTSQPKNLPIYPPADLLTYYFTDAPKCKSGGAITYFLHFHTINLEPYRACALSTYQSPRA